MIELKCLNCGKDFKVYPSRLKDGIVVKTCSVKCKFEYMKTEETKKRKYVNCDYCNKSYLLQNCRNEKTTNNYCSYKCAGLAKSLSKEKVCNHCGKIFLVKKSSVSNNRYCSMDCRIKSKNYGGKTKSNNFYDSKKWKRLRKACLERDNLTCQVCGIKSEKMDVHHIIARSEGGEDLLNNLICVCKSCHVKLDSKLANMNKSEVIYAQA